jgi:hypothetical protein
VPKPETQPSPVGRGCPAAGAFTSRSGTGEGSLPRRGGASIAPSTTHARPKAASTSSGRVFTQTPKGALVFVAAGFSPALRHQRPDTGGTEAGNTALSLGRGCPAAGAFTSRSGTGEGSLPRRGGARSAHLTILFRGVYPQWPWLKRKARPPVCVRSSRLGQTTKAVLFFSILRREQQDCLATKATPHPARDGWRKRHRGPPSPHGRGLRFRLHPRVQPKIWVTISPWGEGYDFDFTPVSSRRSGTRSAPRERASVAQGRKISAKMWKLQGPPRGAALLPTPKIVSRQSRNVLIPAK